MAHRRFDPSVLMNLPTISGRRFWEILRSFRSLRIESKIERNYLRIFLSKMKTTNQTDCTLIDVALISLSGLRHLNSDFKEVKKIVLTVSSLLKMNASRLRDEHSFQGRAEHDLSHV
jgi:hypothetical protein